MRHDCWFNRLIFVSKGSAAVMMPPSDMQVLLLVNVNCLAFISKGLKQAVMMPPSNMRVLHSILAGSTA